MRVCHVWQNFLPLEIGGVERYIIDLSNFVSQQGTDFLLITDKSAPILPGLFLKKCEKYQKLSVYRLGPNIISLFKAVFFKFHLKQKYLDNLLIRFLFKESLNWKELEKVDVFHVHGIWVPHYATLGKLLSQHFDKPLVVSLHGFAQDSKSIGMPLSDSRVLSVLRCSNVITTYSRQVLRQLKEIGLDYKVQFIPNFVMVSSFKTPNASLNHTGAKVLMITRLDSSKDPITVVKAFQHVKKEIPEVTLQIVGYGVLYDYLHYLVKKLGLDDVITFEGQQTNVKPFYSNNDIFIATIGGYITVLEAWAAGLPVIAPDSGITKEIISNGKDGMLFPDGNDRALALAIIKLIRNSAVRKIFIANGYQSVESHDIGKVGPKISEIYNSLSDNN